DARQPDEDRRVAVVVSFREEHVRVERDQRVLVVLTRDADREHLRLGDARLPRVEPFEPDPCERLWLRRAADEEGEAAFLLLDHGERAGDAADVSLRGHRAQDDTTGPRGPSLRAAGGPR